MLVEKWHNTANKILPVLDVIASCVVLFALLPFAGGLPAIASQGDVLPDTLWFTGSLGGAFLFLAGGAKLLFPTAPLVCNCVRSRNRFFRNVALPAFEPALGVSWLDSYGISCWCVPYRASPPLALGDRRRRLVCSSSRLSLRNEHKKLSDN